MGLSYGAGWAWGSSTSPELHLCTSTRSYGLASDEISVLRPDMKGRFKDRQKKKKKNHTKWWRQPRSDMRLLKALEWEINPPPLPPPSYDSSRLVPSLPSPWETRGLPGCWWCTALLRFSISPNTAAGTKCCQFVSVTPYFTFYLSKLLKNPSFVIHQAWNKWPPLNRYFIAHWLWERSNHGHSSHSVGRTCMCTATFFIPFWRHAQCLNRSRPVPYIISGGWYYFYNSVWSFIFLKIRLKSPSLASVDSSLLVKLWSSRSSRPQRFLNSHIATTNNAVFMTFNLQIR